MKTRTMAMLGILGLGILSFMGRRGEPTVSLHPDDWQEVEGGVGCREYRSLGHAFHHWKELVGLGPLTMADVYLRRPISPAFRERIMIVTAACNRCPT